MLHECKVHRIMRGLCVDSEDWKAISQAKSLPMNTIIPFSHDILGPPVPMRVVTEVVVHWGSTVWTRFTEWIRAGPMDR